MKLTGEHRIVYFESPGKQNTEGLMNAVAERLKAGGISHVVVASSTGETAQRAIKSLASFGVQIVVVTSHCGFEEEGKCEMNEEMERSLAREGARVVRASHVLSGIERSISRKLGGVSRVEAVAETLRALFGQGMKVCVEVAVMAADSGAVPCGDCEIVAIGGCWSGADTACVVRPAHANAFFSFEIREIIAMPRSKRAIEGN